jgi:hypothetical protein
MQLALGKIGPIVVQLALAMLASVVVAFAPPAHGRMILVPLDGQPVSRVKVVALQASPLKPGPLPGSLVVDGDRKSLTGLWDQQILVLAAPAALCASG